MNRLSVLPIGFLAIVLLYSFSAAQERPDFRIASFTVPPGSVMSDIIEVPAGADSSTIIPITVIHGRLPGPTLALVGGNHGYEYPPILALARLRRGIDPAELRGTVIMVHVANVPSFLKRTIYYNPWDWKNLNRMYPGDSHGTITQRIARIITTEVIDRCDYLIDVHCGDGNESLMTYSYWMRIGDPAIDEATKQMALAFGFEYIVIDDDRPADSSSSVYCSTTATTRGKPAITIESGALGQVDEKYITDVIRGVTNVMLLEGMISGDARPVQKPKWIDRSEVVRSPFTGMFRATVTRGESVTQGTVLGIFEDFFGEQLGDARAPFDGIVLYVVATPPINAGEPVGFVGHIQEKE